MTIQVNDFIKGSYKFGVICGRVKQVKKNRVVIEKYRQYYESLTPTGEEVNVIISRIHEVNNLPFSQ